MLAGCSGTAEAPTCAIGSHRAALERIGVELRPIGLLATLVVFAIASGLGAKIGIAPAAPVLLGLLGALAVFVRARLAGMVTLVGAVLLMPAAASALVRTVGEPEFGIALGYFNAIGLMGGYGLIHLSLAAAQDALAPLAKG